MMNTHIKTSRKFNSSITKRVIELQAKGYDSDFLIMGDHKLKCLQNNLDFPVDAVNIKVVDQGYDQLTHCFKYVHIIDPGNGDKGVMIADSIVTNN